MARFGTSTLSGNARIADGKLHADGDGAYLVASSTPPHAAVDCLSDLLQRGDVSDEVSRRSPQPCRFTMASTHTGT
jgi:hypothetical protein